MTKLTEQQIIRKAGQLAGWLECDDEGEYLQIPAQPFSAYLDEISAPCEQYLLDALAAELVRMVVLMEGFEIVVCNGETGVMNPLCECIGDAQGSDRTMNTLRAIIESKVLEGGE